MLYELKDLYSGKEIHCPFCEGRKGQYFPAIDGNGNKWMKCDFCDGKGRMIMRLEKILEEKQ